jgi:peptidyl-prolyl cis-trans isomerase SurA
MASGEGWQRWSRHLVAAALGLAIGQGATLTSTADTGLALRLGREAQAGVVERVVAVVGEHAILLSDLRHRARPVLMQIYERVPPGPQRAAVESEMFRELLQQMVDERLIQVAADRSQRRINADEIDNGLKNIAGSQGMTVDELMTAAIQSGITGQELREQVSRQIMEQKMLSLRVLPRVRISSEDVKLGYAKLAREERRRLSYRPQWIVLAVPASSSPEARAERRKLAEQIVGQVRGGADFGQLAARYSDDPATRQSNGDLGTVKPGKLNPQLEEVTMSLDVGEVSAPFNHAGQIVIMRIASRDPSTLPPLDQANDRIASEVYAERVQKARRQWLDELKRSVHVDVRL